MSHENVELVRSLRPEPGMDLVALFRDEAGAARLLDALGPFLQDDVVIVAGAGILGQGSWVGLEGLKAAWAEWLEARGRYRNEIGGVIDAGDDRLGLARDFGGAPGGTAGGWGVGAGGGAVGG